MKATVFRNTLAMAALLAAGGAQAQDVVRLGNLKFAHYGAVSYIKEIAPKCGIKVEERVFAKGLDVMQAIIAGELDVGTTASEAASARSSTSRQFCPGSRATASYMALCPSDSSSVASAFASGASSFL